MIYKKAIIETLELNLNISADYDKNILIDNCIIDKLSIPGNSFSEMVTITNTIIKDFCAVGCYFEGGLLLSNCIIADLFTLEAGGHNRKDKKIIIEQNIFNCFADFFDAHFEGQFIFENNILFKGSNLLGNNGLPTETRFNVSSRIENNLGDLYIKDGN